MDYNLDLTAVIRTIVFLIVFFLYIIAGLLFYNLFQQPKPDNAKKEKNRLLNKIKEQRGWMNELLVNNELEEKFKEAGIYGKLNPFIFQTWRYGILLLLALWIFSLVAMQWNELQPPQIMMMVSLVFVVYLLSSPGKYMFVSMLLGQMKEMNQAEKNRELFMLYNMIAENSRQSKGYKLNLMTVLEEYKEYTTRIQPAINKGMRYYQSKGIQYVLDVIAKEIGTKEADEICKIIADLEDIDPDSADKSIDSREDTYLNALRENKRRRRKLFGSLGYVITYLPMFLYLFNCLNLLWLETSNLTEHSNLG